MKSLEVLLKKAVGPLRSVGLELILQRSHLDKYIHGSDGVRMEGILTVKDETKWIDGFELIKKIEEALGVIGVASRRGDGVWQVDITES